MKSQKGSTLSLTSTFDGLDGQCHAPAALPPGKSRYPLYSRLGGPGSVWTGAGNLAPTGIRSPDHIYFGLSVHPLSQHYPRYSRVHCMLFDVWVRVSISGSQTAVRGSQGIPDRLPGDPWIHFCNGHFKVYLFFN